MEEIQCKFCFSRLQEPVLFQCNHNICLKCVNCMFEFARLIQNDEKTPISVTCPTCRVSTEIPFGQTPQQTLRPNANLRHALGEHEDVPGGEAKLQLNVAITCQNRCPRPATLDCSTCGGSLCDECFTSIHASPLLSSHPRLPVGSATAMLCPKHRKFELELFCLNCQIFLCGICASLKLHKNHDIVAREEYVDEQAQKLLADTQAMTQRFQQAQPNLAHMMRRIEQKTRDVGNMMDSAEAKLHDAVTARFQELRQQAALIAHTRSSSIQQQLACVTSLLDLCVGSVAKAQPHLDGDSSYSQKALVLQLLQNCLNLNMEGSLLQPCVDDVWFSIINTEQLLQDISSLGYVGFMEIPRQPVLSVAQDEKVCLSWPDVATAVSPVSHYVLQAMHQDAKEFESLDPQPAMVCTAGVYNVYLVGVDRSVEWQYCVTAHNQRGTSPPSLPVTLPILATFDPQLLSPGLTLIDNQSTVVFPATGGWLTAVGSRLLAFSRGVRTFTCSVPGNVDNVMFGVSYHKQYPNCSYNQPGVWLLQNRDGFASNGQYQSGGGFIVKNNVQLTMIVDLDAGELRYVAPQHNYNYTLRLDGWDRHTPLAPHVTTHDSNCRISISCRKRIA